ncbi:MAG: response regulator transcription factor [Paludibacteraceae bacterium]|nr:response regulator transcription factor [Paludibacteraceae bacterium]
MLDNINKRTILLCEDDENLGTLLREYLMAKGFEVTFMPDGETGYEAFMNENQNFDICIFDVMMPKKDGFALAAEIRKVNGIVPIVFLTARALKEDVLEGFRIGCDDYITKPFSMEELVYRIEAILRRVSGKDHRNASEFQLGKILFDSQKQTLTTPDKQLKLTTKENELLLLLVQNANSILQRDYALKAIWMEDNYFNARSMDVYITKLRKILRIDQDVEIINIHGKGYKLIIPNKI